ncbi:MAG: T9SS C-terminal target domain-containing protein [Chitinophagaceae bacterium]|nr:MAG: T9SS C-terminal target domain-containing protein [Chitinophagaceae bacterium]
MLSGFKHTLMKYLYLFILYILFFSNISLKAQQTPTFIRGDVFSIPSNMTYDVVETNSGYLAAYSQSINYIDLPAFSMFAKFDFNGNLIDTLHLPKIDSIPIYYSHLIELLNDSTAIIQGRCDTTVRTFGRFAFFAEVDLNTLKFNWFTYVDRSIVEDSTYQQEIRNVVEDFVIDSISGNIYFVGHTIYDDYYSFPHWQSFQKFNVLLGKMSSQGELLWVKEYKKHEHHLYGGQINLDYMNNQILIAGSQRDSYKHPLLPTAYLPLNYPLVIITDMDGNELDRLENNFVSDYELGVSRTSSYQPTPDGGYVMVGRAFEIVENMYPLGNPNFWYDQFVTQHISKYDANHQYLWHWDGHLAVSAGHNDYRYSQLVVNDDNTYVAGGHCIIDAVWSWNGEQGVICMHKLSEDGDSLWRRYYHYLVERPGNRPHFIYFLKKASDGGYLITGKIYDMLYIQQETPIQHAVLIKTDSMGCVVPGCDTCHTATCTEEFFYDYHPDDLIDEEDTTSVFTPEKLQLKLQVYPNPASNHLFFMPSGMQQPDVAIIRLYDMSGRQVREFETQLFNGHQYIMDISNLQAGNYLLQVEGENYQYQTEKILIQ